jgi:hypothetical protein
MEDYNWAIFTHAMDFFKVHANLKKPRLNSKTFFHKLIKGFVDRIFSKPWQLAINVIHETMEMIICNSK